MDQFGKYELIEQIGKGGMAEVYLAKEKMDGGVERKVVVKRILNDYSEDEEFITMFLDEAKLVSQLSHPNIALVYDFGEFDKKYYITMEHIDGPSVSSLMKMCKKIKGIPLSHASYVISEILNGLQYAHTKTDLQNKPLKIVHRDISPQNVLISKQGAIKIVDFGVAKSKIQKHLTLAGVLKGKYSYMAPELCQRQKWDHRVDLWAAGVLFHEMLTGRSLFRKKVEIATIQSILNDPIPKISDVKKDIPPEVDQFLDKVLQKNPDKRFKTAQDMLLELEELIDKIGMRSTAIRLSNFINEMTMAETESSIREIVDSDSAYRLDSGEIERNMDVTVRDKVIKQPENVIKKIDSKPNIEQSKFFEQKPTIKFEENQLIIKKSIHTGQKNNIILPAVIEENDIIITGKYKVADKANIFPVNDTKEQKQQFADNLQQPAENDIKSELYIIPSTKNVDIEQQKLEDFDLKKTLKRINTPVAQENLHEENLYIDEQFDNEQFDDAFSSMKTIRRNKKSKSSHIKPQEKTKKNIFKKFINMFLSSTDNQLITIIYFMIFLALISVLVLLIKNCL